MQRSSLDGLNLVWNVRVGSQADLGLRGEVFGDLGAPGAEMEEAPQDCVQSETETARAGTRGKPLA